MGGEEGSGNKVNAVVGAFIKPGFYILKSWQGIVEISLRTAIAVLLFITIIAGGASQSAVDNINISLAHRTNAAAGWIIFVCVMGLIYELLIIIQRFINILFINTHIFIALIVDAIVHAVLVVGLFAGAVALASYVPDWKRARSGTFRSTAVQIVLTSEATAVFSFFSIIVLIGTAVFTMLGALMFKWNPTLAKYSSGGGGGGGGGGDSYSKE